jgi:transcriptional regulator with XRE-family HTH domain
MPSSSPKGPKSNRAVGPIDVDLGSKIRSRRIQLRVTEKGFGDEIGVTAQQVRSYERGFNKLSVSQLIHIAHVLDCRVADLIGDVDSTAGREPVDIRLDLTGASLLLAAYHDMPTGLRQATLELLVGAEKARDRKRRRGG